MLWWKKLQLAMGSQETKLDALRRLADSGAPGAVDILIEALQDRDGKVPIVAAEALGRLRDPRAVRPLMNALRDKDDYICWTAADALGQLGTPAVAPLIAALRDANTNVRTAAARALGKIGVQALPPLAETLRHPSVMMRLAAVEALANIHTEQSASHLLTALNDREDSVRDKAARALVQVGKTAVPGLLQTLNQLPGGAVRQRALWALERLGAEPLTETYVRPVIHGKWKDVAQVGTQDLVTLTAALKERDKTARATAVQTLANVGDERAVPGLMLALLDADRDIREAATHALVKIGAGAVPLLCEALRQGVKDLRPRAADVLGYIADAGALAPLRTALADSDPCVRSAAVEALPALKDPACVPAVLERLRDPDPRVRFSAVGASWKFGDPRAVPVLLELLDDPDRPTQTRACQALGDLGDEACLEPLMTLFRCDRAARLEAALAVAKIKPGPSVPLLVELAEEGADAAAEAVEILTEVIETAAAKLTPADLQSVAGLPDRLSSAGTWSSQSAMRKMPVDAGRAAQLAEEELVRRGLRTQPARGAAGGRSADDARDCSRRRTRAVPMHILHGMHQIEPVAARLFDISAGGLGLIARQSYATGTLLTVRPPEAPPEVPWVLVETRYAQKTPDGWRIGCKFVRQPSHTFHVFLGHEAEAARAG
jgi:HEAT repeat protein